MKVFRASPKKYSLFVAMALVVLLSPSSLRAAMNDYCIVPPYVVQNIQPNVMLVVDTSGSMFNFAYSDGFETTSTADDHACTTADPCTGFTNPGTYPDYKYYGYFDPDYWYTYTTSGSKFVRAAPKTGSGLTGERDKGSTEWDGSFLNWVSMRRGDVLRNVLTGGKKGDRRGDGVRPDRRGTCGLRLPGNDQDPQRNLLHSVQRKQDLYGQQRQRRLRRGGGGRMVVRRERRLGDVQRSGGRDVAGRGRFAGGGRCEGPRRTHLLQRQHGREGARERQRREPLQHPQRRQQHQALHQHPAGGNAVVGYGILRPASVDAERTGTPLRDERLRHQQQRRPVELRPGNTEVADLLQELRSVHHRRRTVLRRVAARHPRELRRRPFGL